MFCPFQAKICPVSYVWVSELAGPLDQSLQCTYFLLSFLFKMYTSEKLLCSNYFPSVCILFSGVAMHVDPLIRCNLSMPAFSPSHHWLGRSILSDVTVHLIILPVAPHQAVSLSTFFLSTNSFWNPSFTALCIVCIAYNPTWFHPPLAICMLSPKKSYFDIHLSWSTAQSWTSEGDAWPQPFFIHPKFDSPPCHAMPAFCILLKTVWMYEK